MRVEGEVAADHPDGRVFLGLNLAMRDVSKANWEIASRLERTNILRVQEPIGISQPLDPQKPGCHMCLADEHPK